MDGERTIVASESDSWTIRQSRPLRLSPTATARLAAIKAMIRRGAAGDPERLVAHDWLVVIVAAELSCEGEVVESVEAVVVAFEVEATVVVVAPLEPSKATTPCGRGRTRRGWKATIRCRITRMRRARAASFSWAMAEGMRSLSGRAVREPRENP